MGLIWGLALAGLAGTGGIYNVRDYGAKGDGQTLDSPAINRAIEAAAADGGGTVRLSAGTYRSVSIHLKSNINLDLGPGAVLKAATWAPGTEYDAAEPAAGRYQDFGHSHFHNSLIWGEGLQNVSIVGQGEIWGEGLVHDTTQNPTDGNKSIALRDCRNVTIRDVTIRHGGWFCILATGVDHMEIDHLTIDTNRDGMDIDCCRDAHITDCSVNSPHDDGICLKSSYALGEARATENVTITGCLVSGYQEGTLLDGTFVRRGRPTGRIKFGTESNGGFKNIAISNCVFDYCGGLALETVDGGDLEDVTISNITMRDVVNSPFYLRLGARLRGPKGIEPGKLRRVTISNVRVVRAREASIISGIPGSDVDDVKIDNVQIESLGGAKASEADLTPREDEKGYPEPTEFGRMPANGFFVRHARNIRLSGVDMSWDAEDKRPPFVLDDVDGFDLFHVHAERSAGVDYARLEAVRNLRISSCEGVRDTRKGNVDTGKI